MKKAICERRCIRADEEPCDKDRRVLNVRSFFDEMRSLTSSTPEDTLAIRFSGAYCIAIPAMRAGASERSENEQECRLRSHMMADFSA